MKKAVFRLIFCGLFVAVSLTSSNVFGEEAKPGSPAPLFSLADTSSTARSLSDYAGKFVVLEWNNPDCPFVRKHYDSGNMQALQKKYGEKDVVWLMINSSTEGRQGHYTASDHNKILADRAASPAALLLDTDGNVGRLYGARTTPHMYVIDPKGILIYNGAIDSDPSANPDSIRGAVNYVAQCLDEAMAGKGVSEPVTKPYGCSVKYA